MHWDAVAGRWRGARKSSAARRRNSEARKGPISRQIFVVVIVGSTTLACTCFLFVWHVRRAHSGQARAASARVGVAVVEVALDLRLLARGACTLHGTHVAVARHPETDAACAWPLIVARRLRALAVFARMQFRRAFDSLFALAFALSIG